MISPKSGSRYIEGLPSDEEMEKSKISPDSDRTPPPPPPPHSYRSTVGSTPRNPHGIPEDVESLHSHRYSDRPNTFSNIFFNLRAHNNDGNFGLVPLSPLALDVESAKHPSATYPTPGHSPQKKRRFRWCTVLLILIILALLGNVIFLDVRVVELTQVINGNASSPLGPASNSSPEAAGECLSQFTIDAPSNPSAYPCSTCLPILLNSTNNSDAANAVQFCGLRAILESTSTTGQTALSNGGWGKNLRVCTWSGVSCSDSGLVTSLQLTFPAVPALIPTEISAFSQLQSLQVIGDGNYPAGALPDSFRNLTSLTTLHLESTAITTIPNDLFSLLTKVTDLTLIANGQFSGNLTLITSLPLQSLVLRNQRLGNPIGNLAESHILQNSLRVLDLSSNSLSGSIPASISFLTVLTQLHLDNNDLGQAVPSAFPHSLQSLTISNNSNLSGTLPSDLCSSTSLKECDLRGTRVNKTSGCGVCQF